MRYRGQVRVETHAYGFLMEARDSKGDPPPNVGAGQGVFLRAATAKRCLNITGSKTMRVIENDWLSFEIKESEMKPGMIEACNLSRI